MRRHWTTQQRQVVIAALQDPTIKIRGDIKKNLRGDVFVTYEQSGKVRQDRIPRRPRPTTVSLLREAS